MRDSQWLAFTVSRSRPTEWCFQVSSHCPKRQSPCSPEKQSFAQTTPWRGCSPSRSHCPWQNQDCPNRSRHLMMGTKLSMLERMAVPESQRTSPEILINMARTWLILPTLPTTIKTPTPDLCLPFLLKPRGPEDKFWISLSVFAWPCWLS